MSDAEAARRDGQGAALLLRCSSPPPRPLLLLDLASSSPESRGEPSTHIEGEAY